ncbi:Uncharacterised protein [Klebsiella michiganensis]|nr:Uncharacterised protein [Klebsiella michiganensis]
MLAASEARYFAWLSPTLDSLRVGSRRATTCPACTLLPSRTFSSVKIPPSRVCITCSRELGITFPVPVETSSSTAEPCPDAAHQQHNGQQENQPPRFNNFRLVFFAIRQQRHRVVIGHQGDFISYVHHPGRGLSLAQKTVALGLSSASCPSWITRIRSTILSTAALCRGDDHRSLAGPLRQLFHKGLFRSLIEKRGRFIEQDNVRIAQQRPGQQQRLPLAA